MTDFTACSTQMEEKYVKEVRALVRKKAGIEREMARLSDELQQAYLRTRDILEVVLDGRNDEYVEALKTLEDFKICNASPSLEKSREA